MHLSPVELEALLSEKGVNIPGDSPVDKTHSPGEDSATTLVSEPGDVAMGDAENNEADEIPVIDLDVGRGIYWTNWPSELPAPETMQLM